MPMFKDLMKSIFNEDIDLDEEETEENKKPETTEENEKEESKVEVKKEETKEEAKPEPQEQTIVTQPSEDIYSKEAQEAVIDQIVNAPKEEEKPKAKTLGSLDADVVKKKETRPKRTETYHYDRRKLNPTRPRKTNVNIEYQNVMSPIFGNTQDKDKDFDKIHNAVDLEKPIKPDSLEEVISPMFGSDLPTVTKEKAKSEQEVTAADKESKKEESKVKEEPEVMEVSEMIEKKPEKEEKPKQEKLFVSKN